MWIPKFVDASQIHMLNIDFLLSGKIPAIVIRNFYDVKTCKAVVHNIKRQQPNDFQNGKLQHIGPFLMSYTTKKQKYFETSKRYQRIFDEIFFGLENPVTKIHDLIKLIYPDHLISLAKELKNNYSPFVIRIHQKGRSIPIHKDNVSYEGKEYFVSDIDYQLSCVLHLQESEYGGDLVIYNKKWEKSDERFRNVNFGYSSELVKSDDFCQISSIQAGDLVIINPKYFHKVTKIAGTTPRITLGMFLGMYKNRHNIVAWA